MTAGANEPMTARVVRVHELGGPDVMQFETVELPAPPEGFARIKHTAVALNYIDTYHRTGLYPLPLPTGLGVEGAGVVESVGAGVSNLKEGDRVAYVFAPGCYAEAALIPASRLVKLPDSMPDEIAAASFLKGLTAEYLLRRTYPVKAGDTILVHAAAGGVGLILCQWASHLGATVIGTVGSEDKAKLAKAHGASHTILYREEDFLPRVMELTGGMGVPVVYDSVGKDTVPSSVKCLQPRGMLVSFGNASGLPDPVGFDAIAAQGSIFVTRPSLFNYIAADEELAAASAAWFDVVASGAVKIDVHQRYKFDDVVKAHQDMEARVTTGSSILVI